MATVYDMYCRGAIIR